MVRSFEWFLPFCYKILKTQYYCSVTLKHRVSMQLVLDWNSGKDEPAQVIMYYKILGKLLGNRGRMSHPPIPPHL